MLSAFRSALTTPDLRRKILFTLGIVAVYRLGATIPSPGVSYPLVQQCLEQVQGGETSSVYRDDPGLGLPLSQRLCRLMNGELTADSELGRGSCFTIRIPSQPAQQKAANAPRSDVLAMAC